MCLVDFGLRHIGSHHTVVSKKARDMFLKGARLMAGGGDKAASELKRLLEVLDPNLQVNISQDYLNGACRLKFRNLGPGDAANWRHRRRGLHACHLGL